MAIGCASFVGGVVGGGAIGCAYFLGVGWGVIEDVYTVDRTG